MDLKARNSKEAVLNEIGRALQFKGSAATAAEVARELGKARASALRASLVAAPPLLMRGNSAGGSCASHARGARRCTRHAAMAWLQLGLRRSTRAPHDHAPARSVALFPRRWRGRSCCSSTTRRMP